MPKHSPSVPCILLTALVALGARDGHAQQMPIVSTPAVVEVKNDSPEQITIRFADGGNSAQECSVPPQKVTRCTLPPGNWSWAATGGENLLEGTQGHFSVDSQGFIRIACYLASKIMSECSDGANGGEALREKASALRALVRVGCAVRDGKANSLKGDVVLPLKIESSRPGNKATVIKDEKNLVGHPRFKSLLLLDTRFISATQTALAELGQGEAICARSGPFSGIVNWSKGPKAVSVSNANVTVTWLQDPCTDHEHKVIALFARGGRLHDWQLKQVTEQTPAADAGTQTRAWLKVVENCEKTARDVAMDIAEIKETFMQVGSSVKFGGISFPTEDGHVSLSLGFQHDGRIENVYFVEVVNGSLKVKAGGMDEEIAVPESGQAKVKQACSG